MKDQKYHTVGTFSVYIPTLFLDWW